MVTNNELRGQVDMMEREELRRKLMTTRILFNGHVKNSRIVDDIGYRLLYSRIVEQISFIYLHHERFGDSDLRDYLLTICHPASIIKDTKRNKEDRIALLGEISGLVDEKEAFMREVYGYGKDSQVLESTHDTKEVKFDESSLKTRDVGQEQIMEEPVAFVRAKVELAQGTIPPPKPLDTNTYVDAELYNVDESIKNIRGYIEDCSLFHNMNLGKKPISDFHEEVNKIYYNVITWGKKALAISEKPVGNSEERAKRANMIEKCEETLKDMTSLLQTSSVPNLARLFGKIQENLSELETNYGSIGRII